MADVVDLRLIGTHQLVLEDDVVFLTHRGDFTLADAVQMNVEVEAVLKRLGRAFILIDLTHARSMPPEVRRYLAEWNKQHKPSGAILFGASAVSRAVATLVLAAIRIFRADSLPTLFMATEAEARGWIEVQRAKILATPRGS